MVHYTREEKEEAIKQYLRGELTRDEAYEITGNWWGPTMARVQRDPDFEPPDDDGELEAEIRAWAEAKVREWENDEATRD